LTGLPNRALLMDRLDTAVKLADRHNCKLAIIFIDLDGFKAVNDTYGHQSGDELLEIIATRFNATLRRSDTIARVGGDEFIVLLNRTKSVKDSQIVAQNLLNVIKQPIELQTGTVYVGASLGIALFPDHSTDAKTLIDLADHAMYKVKHEGKNNYAYYQESNN
jgi:diguanylate cyclase (GGDEF)-like protein